MTQGTVEYNKPLPELKGLNKEFYDHCKAHNLSFQRCLSCRTWRHVPRDMCDECGSDQWEWAKSSGKGKIFSWTVVHRALHPSFKEDIPYGVAIVEMDEGVRIVSQVVDCPTDEIRLGMPVTIVYDDVTPEVTLPKFRRI